MLKLDKEITPMEKECKLITIITIIMIEVTETINITTSMIQRKGSTIQITSGINIMDGDSRNHQVKLLHRMIHHLISKDLITIMMINVIKEITGLE